MSESVRLPQINFEVSDERLLTAFGWLVSSQPVYGLLEVRTRKSSTYGRKKFTITNFGVGLDDEGTAYLVGMNADEPECLDFRLEDIKSITLI